MYSLPQGWEVKKLGEVAVVSTGNSAPQDKSFFKNGVFPFIRTSDVGKIKKGSIRSCIDYLNSTGIRKLKLFEKGTILFPKSGASTFLNHRVIMDIDGYVSSHLATIKPNEIFENKFVWYYLVTIEARNLMQDIAYPSLKLSDIKNILIPIPPLPEQKRIVAILEKAFTAIDQAKANTEKNLKNARELFQSKLQETFDNGKLKIDNGKWEEKKLREVIHKTETVNPKLNLNEKFIYIDVSSVNKETKKIEKTSILLGKDAPSRARKLVKTNDVIFATVRPTHSRVAIITEQFDNQVCSTGYYVLRAKNILNNIFIYYFFLTLGFNKEMEKLQKGANYPAVTNKEVESRKIIYPKSLAEQKQIVKNLDTVSTETKKLETIYQQKITCLDELKKSILQKAFNGEL